MLQMTDGIVESGGRRCSVDVKIERYCSEVHVEVWRLQRNTTAGPGLTRTDR